MSDFYKSFIVKKSIFLYLFFYNIYEVQSDYEKCLITLNKSFSDCATPTECLRKYIDRSTKPSVVPDFNKSMMKTFLEFQPYPEKYGYYLSIYATYGHIKKPIIFCRLMYPTLLYVTHYYEDPAQSSTANNKNNVSIPTRVRKTDGKIIFDGFYEARDEYKNLIISTAVVQTTNGTINLNNYYEAEGNNQHNNQMHNTVVVEETMFITPEDFEIISNLESEMDILLVVFKNDYESLGSDPRYHRLATLRNSCYHNLKKKNIHDSMSQRKIFLTVLRKIHRLQPARGYIADAYLTHVINGATLPDEVKNPIDYCLNIDIINDAIIKTWDDNLNIPNSSGITSYVNLHSRNKKNVHRDVTVNTTPLNTDLYASNNIPFYTPNYAGNTIPLNTPNYAGNTIPLNTPYYAWNNMPYNTTNNAWNNMPYYTTNNAWNNMPDNTTNDTENEISHISDTSTRSTINLMSYLDRKTLPDFRITNNEDQESPASSSNDDWLKLKIN